MASNIEESIREWDDPSRAVDKLNRTEFAERVCKGLEDWSSPESLIVAVYGEWGEGKTWLLNSIDSHLSKSESIVVCRFSPWQYESNEQITAEFFALVLAQLNSCKDKSREAKERASLWLSLGQIATIGQLGAAAFAAVSKEAALASTALGALGSLLGIGGEKAAKEGEKKGVSDIRKQLTNLFKAEDAPRILVAIDDLDRLEDAQIQMVLRLIKTNANFPNLNYLILGERKQLANALNPIASGHGDRYLEKIVHIPLTLPKANSLELQHRLWEGLEDVASRCGYPLDESRQRFEHIWSAFLKGRLTNLRSVHRLLTTTSFHAKCLTNETLLEVDLLDLLGIDFVRIFAPNLYQRMASDPPTESWAALHRHFPLSREDEKEDSEVALDLIKSSELGFESTYNFLTILFPPVSGTLPKLGQQQRFWLSSNEKFRLQVHQRPVWHDQFAPFYFQLSTQAGDLPLSRYRHFLATDNARDLIALLESWTSNGWRKQLLRTLNEDSTVAEAVASCRELLLAIASVSDELVDGGEGLGRELQNAKELWFEVFKKIPEGDRFDLIRYVLDGTRGISIPLLVIEQLRDRNKATFSKGARSHECLPAVERDEIERLTDNFMPQVCKRFHARKFPVDSGQAGRFYRLAHAIGPERMQHVLEKEIDSEAGLAIAKAVAGNLCASLQLDLFEKDSVFPEVSKNVVESLCQFGSVDYWKALRKQVLEVETPDPIETILLDHIAMGAKAMNEDFINETQ